jgi:hypothetical protein
MHLKHPRNNKTLYVIINVLGLNETWASFVPYRY